MVAPTYNEDEDWEGAEELALIDSDERLPWLESAEDDETPGGIDNTRLLLMGAIALAVLAVVVAGLWYVASEGVGGGPEADGSVIAAPEMPYKQKPEDEGGKTFPGTGDTSFAVGEGQTRDARLASRPAASEAPGPAIATTLDDPQPAQAKPAAQGGGVAVQVGAYSRREQAEEGWVTLLRATEVLSGVNHRVVEGQADIGRVFRLQAVMGDRASANRLCQALKNDGLACQVK